MNEEEAKAKAQYLIDKGYVEGKDVDELGKEILENINKDVSHGTAIPANSSTNKE